MATSGLPVPKLTFTGERFLPGCSGEIAYEHWHRYALARRFVAGKRVLDAACGEGYGTVMLNAVASSIVGVDIDVATINHAKSTYGESARMRFLPASCVGMPLPSASIDVVVSFETIEHVEAAEQKQIISEFSRVLKPDGLLIISSPNKRLYSEQRNYINKYHVHELDREGLRWLIAPKFPAQRWLHQRLGYWSAIWNAADGSEKVEAWIGDEDKVEPFQTPEAMYFIVVAARTVDSLPEVDLRVSLFTDADESAVKQAEADAREALRLDELLKQRDAALAEKTELARHLELVAAERKQALLEREVQLADFLKVAQERDRAAVAREREIAEAIAVHERKIAEYEAELGMRAEAILISGKKLSVLDAERVRQEAALAAQERVIGYLESFRGWAGWPLRRFRQWRARAR